MSGTIRCACCNLPIPVTTDDVGLTVTCPRTRKLIPVKESDVRAVRTSPAPKSATARPVPREPAANRTNRLLVGVVCAQTLLLVGMVAFFVARERRASIADRDGGVPATSRVEPSSPTPDPAARPPEVRKEKVPVTEPKDKPRRDPAPVSDPPLPAPRPVPAVEAPPPGKVAKAPDALRALLADLKAKEPADRIKTLGAIATLGPEAGEAAGEDLIETMEDKSPAVRQAAAEALEKVCPKVYPHVFTLLFGMDRGGALYHLGELRGKAAVAVPLLLRLDGTGTFYEKHYTWGAIAQIAPKDKRFATVVLAAVADHESIRRWDAIDLLRVIDASTEAKVKALVTALEDGYDVRKVIEALERFGKDAAPALPALRKMKFSPNDVLRDLATRAIAKIE